MSVDSFNDWLGLVGYARSSRTGVVEGVVSALVQARITLNWLVFGPRRLDKEPFKTYPVVELGAVMSS